MVDPASSAALRALQNAQSASLIGLKSGQQAQQAIITQLQKTSSASRSTAIQPAVKSASPSADLPRGSLVDILA